MTERTRIGASGDKGKSSDRVDKLLQQLDKPTFDALAAPQRQEIMRRALVLLLELVLKRLLK